MLLIFIICLSCLNACLVLLWYSFRVIKVIFAYHSGWGIASIVGFLLGMQAMIAGLFLMDNELEEEEERVLFKRLFLSFACVLIFGAGLIFSLMKSGEEHEEVGVQDTSYVANKANVLSETSQGLQTTKAKTQQSNQEQQAQNEQPVRVIDKNKSYEEQVRYIHDMGVKHLKNDPEWLKSKAEIRDYLGTHPTSVQINDMLNIIVEDVNKNKPIQVAHWEIMRTSASHLEYHTHMRLTSLFHSFKEVDEQADEQKRQEMIKENDICSIFDVFFDYNISLSYHLYNKGNGYVKTIKISPSDCP